MNSLAKQILSELSRSLGEPAPDGTLTAWSYSAKPADADGVIQHTIVFDVWRAAAPIEQEGPEPEPIGHA